MPSGSWPETPGRPSRCAAVRSSGPWSAATNLALADLDGGRPARRGDEGRDPGAVLAAGDRRLPQVRPQAAGDRGRPACQSRRFAGHDAGRVSAPDPRGGPGGSATWRLATPTACMAFDAICQNGPARRAARRDRGGTGGLHEDLPEKLKSLDSLPAPVKERLDQGRDEPAVVEALAIAGLPGEDPGESSWGVLAHLAREARFVQAFRRLDFMANMWHVPAADAFQEFRPLVAAAPLLPLCCNTLPCRAGGCHPGAGRDGRSPRPCRDRSRPSDRLIDAFREIKLPAGERRLGCVDAPRQPPRARYRRAAPADGHRQGPFRAHPAEHEPVFGPRDGHPDRGRLGPGQGRGPRLAEEGRRGPGPDRRPGPEVCRAEATTTRRRST